MSRHHSDGSSVSNHSSGSSRSSSRSSSTSSLRSGSSKKSRFSQVSHSNIKGDHWSVSFMKWTTGAPLGKPLSLRRTKVREIEDDWGYDDGATVYSDSSYTQYAWVTPKWDDSISEIASRSSSRSAGQLRREHRSRGPPRFVPPPVMHQPPPLHHPHPPPPPPFMPPPPMCDDDQGYDGYPPEPMFHHHPPPPPPPPPVGVPGDGPGFINLGASGGGGIRNYEPW